MTAAARRQAQHGTRSKYVAGCHCDQCVAANRAYARERERRLARIRYGIEQEPPSRFVDAAEARDHLRWLRSQGIGRRTVAARTGLMPGTIRDIATGETTVALPSTVNRILAVGRSATPPQTHVDSAPTLELIEDLVARGHTRARLATMLGYRSPALQFKPGRPVTERTRRRVEALHRLLTDPRRTGQGAA